MDPFDIPENLEELSDEELSELLDAGLAAFGELELTEDSDEETVIEAERVAPLLSKIREVQRTRSDALEARRARAKAVRDSVEPASTEDVPEASEGVLEPVSAAVEPVVVAAAEPRRPSYGSPVVRAAANMPLMRAPRNRGVAVLTASADVPGLANGQELDDFSLGAKAVISRARGLPTTNIGKVRNRYGTLNIHKTGFGDLVQGANGIDDYSLVHKACDQSRLPGGSLVAAGGWCAPSETLYDLCTYETLEGILSIPEFHVNRGGIRWTTGPDYSTVYNECGFHQTEAEAIAGDCKTCCEPDCPAFDEIRLDPIGLCVKVPILLNVGYPEIVRRHMELALIAQQHKVNAWVISQMELAAGAPTTAQEQGSLIMTLEALTVQAIGMRYSYRLSQTAPLEIVAPYWLKELIKIDLARAARGSDESRSVSDAEVNSWFSARNLSVQWVYDYQDPTVAGCSVTIPNTATVLMYPAGTWAKGTTDIINLDTVYDSVGLESNMYTALFVEEGALVVQKCTSTCAVTLPVCATGAGVVLDITGCFPSVLAT